MTKSMREITAEEFVRRLKVISSDIDKRFAIFLGAGCSVSSGIPTAGQLVRDIWLPRLRDLCSPEQTDLASWAKREFPEYDPNNPSRSYGVIMERLLFSPEERQREIENLCDGRFPSFGYAVISNLVSPGGGHFNVILTTNFDDLMADALYLFSSSRPLVIHHEALAGYIRPTRTRPLMVKLHGDHRLSPHNTSEETATLQVDIDKQVRLLLHDRGLIFIGYGGNDSSIKNMLEQIPREGLPLGVFWVSNKEPDCLLRPWLESRDATWVRENDFDELMLLVKDNFGLPHPDRQRFEDVFSKYKDTYDTLSLRVVALPNTVPDASAMKEAIKRTDKSFPDWWDVEVRASRLKVNDPSGADEIYKEGIQKFPHQKELLENYAIFLTTLGKDYDRAEEFFKKALEVDPNYTVGLNNFATFLKNKRKDYNQAEELFKKALEVNPRDSNALGKYGAFMKNIRKDYGKAEELLKKALDVDPRNSSNIGTYAGFLTEIRKDLDKAEELYKKALEIDPRNPSIHGNYAVFLTKVRKDQGKAEEFFKKALEIDPNNITILNNYAVYLSKVKKNYDKAEELFRKAMEIDASDPNPPGSYANFMKVVRKDYGKAEELYKKALKLDANNVYNLCNYAGFLLGQGKQVDGLSVLDKTLPLVLETKDTQLAVEFWFYSFAHRPEEKRVEALHNLKVVLKSGGRSFEWDFNDNIVQARKDKHPDSTWLDILAKVISEGADILLLEEWSRWKQA